MTTMSDTFLVTVLANEDLPLAHALRVMATCRQLCAEVRAAIP